MAYQEFIRTSIQQREKIIPRVSMPIEWKQIDAWMRPKLLEAVPNDIKQWVSMRAREGTIDSSHCVIFYVLKTFGPGGAEEKIQLSSNITNPKCCSQPRAAQLELLRWKESLRRSAELGIAPPDTLLAYRAMESIFSAVFDKAEPQLHARWVPLRNQLGLPHVVQKVWKR